VPRGVDRPQICFKIPESTPDLRKKSTACDPESSAPVSPELAAFHKLFLNCHFKSEYYLFKILLF
jgi:hypothetical protein